MTPYEENLQNFLSLRTPILEEHRCDSRAILRDIQMQHLLPIIPMGYAKNNHLVESLLLLEVANHQGKTPALEALFSQYGVLLERKSDEMSHLKTQFWQQMEDIDKKYIREEEQLKASKRDMSAQEYNAKLEALNKAWQKEADDLSEKTNVSIDAIEKKYQKESVLSVRAIATHPSVLLLESDLRIVIDNIQSALQIRPTYLFEQTKADKLEKFSKEKDKLKAEYQQQISKIDDEKQTALANFREEMKPKREEIKKTFVQKKKQVGEKYLRRLAGLKRQYGIYVESTSLPAYREAYAFFPPKRRDEILATAYSFANLTETMETSVRYAYDCLLLEASYALSTPPASIRSGQRKPGDNRKQIQGFRFHVGSDRAKVRILRLQNKMRSKKNRAGIASRVASLRQTLQRRKAQKQATKWHKHHPMAGRLHKAQGQLFTERRIAIYDRSLKGASALKHTIPAPLLEGQVVETTYQFLLETSAIVEGNYHPVYLLETPFPYLVGVSDTNTLIQGEIQIGETDVNIVGMNVLLEQQHVDSVLATIPDLIKGKTVNVLSQEMCTEGIQPLDEDMGWMSYAAIVSSVSGLLYAFGKKAATKVYYWATSPLYSYGIPFADSLLLANEIKNYAGLPEETLKKQTQDLAALFKEFFKYADIFYYTKLVYGEILTDKYMETVVNTFDDYSQSIGALLGDLQNYKTKLEALKQEIEIKKSEYLNKKVPVDTSVAHYYEDQPLHIEVSYEGSAISTVDNKKRKPKKVNENNKILPADLETQQKKKNADGDFLRRFNGMDENAVGTLEQDTQYFVDKHNELSELVDAIDSMITKWFSEVNSQRNILKATTRVEYLSGVLFFNAMDTIKGNSIVKSVFKSAMFTNIMYTTVKTKIDMVVDQVSKIISWLEKEKTQTQKLTPEDILNLFYKKISTSSSFKFTNLFHEFKRIVSAINTKLEDATDNLTKQDWKTYIDGGYKSSEPVIANLVTQLDTQYNFNPLLRDLFVVYLESGKTDAIVDFIYGATIVPVSVLLLSIKMTLAQTSTLASIISTFVAGSVKLNSPKVVSAAQATLAFSSNLYKKYREGKEVILVDAAMSQETLDGVVHKQEKNETVVAEQKISLVKRIQQLMASPKYTYLTSWIKGKLAPIMFLKSVGTITVVSYPIVYTKEANVGSILVPGDWFTVLSEVAENKLLVKITTNKGFGTIQLRTALGVYLHNLTLGTVNTEVATPTKEYMLAEVAKYVNKKLILKTAQLLVKATTNEEQIISKGTVIVIPTAPKAARVKIMVLDSVDGTNFFATASLENVYYMLRELYPLKESANMLPSLIESFLANKRGKTLLLEYSSYYGEENLYNETADDIVDKVQQILIVMDALDALQDVFLDTSEVIFAFDPILEQDEIAILVKKIQEKYPTTELIASVDEVSPWWLVRVTTVEDKESLLAAQSVYNEPMIAPEEKKGNLIVKSGQGVVNDIVQEIDFNKALSNVAN